VRGAARVSINCFSSGRFSNPELGVTDGGRIEIWDRKENKFLAMPAVNVPSGIPVFVLKSGSVLTVGNYSYQGGRITYTLAGGGGGVISSDEVDWNTTTRANAQRGVRMTLHGGKVNPETPGM